MHSTATLLRRHSAAPRKGQCVASHPASPLRRSGAVLVVPGYLLDARDFVPLVERLRCRGFEAALPPIRWYNWLPTLGGRSLRPILDRIDFAARLLSAGASVDASSDYELQPSSSATWLEFLQEMQDPSKGIRPSLQERVEEESATQRIAIVGSSAAGWMCRIWLGEGPEYGGRVYAGRRYVHTLVTLGSPHICNEGVTRNNVAFVNRHYPGAFEEDVKYLCVAGRAVQGNAYLGGVVKDFTYQSYELCSLNGRDWGDGVTPVQCAVGLKGAQHLVLDDVWHSPKDGRRWYGSEDVLSQWSDFLIDGI